MWIHISIEYSVKGWLDKFGNSSQNRWRWRHYYNNFEPILRKGGFSKGQLVTSRQMWCLQLQGRVGTPYLDMLLADQYTLRSVPCNNRATQVARAWEARADATPMLMMHIRPGESRISQTRTQVELAARSTKVDTLSNRIAMSAPRCMTDWHASRFTGCTGVVVGFTRSFWFNSSKSLFRCKRILILTAFIIETIRYHSI